jgi:hypothetical protein
MSMTTVAYARRAYKSFSRSARHLYQLIASHQNLHTSWAYLGYDCLSEESSLTPRRVMQLIAFLETHHASKCAGAMDVVMSISIACCVKKMARQCRRTASKR